MFITIIHFACYVNSGTLYFIVRRVIYAIFTLIILIVFLFLLIHIIAPNPLELARIYAGNPHIPTTTLENIVKRYGLNQPVYIQIISYISMIFHVNLGMDPIYNAPELTLIGTFFPITLELVFPAIIVAVLLGIFTGAIAASRRGKPTDYGVKILYLSSWGTPPFLVAILLQLVVAYDLKLLPAVNMVNPILTAPPSVTPFPLINAIWAGDWTYFVSLIHHMILPAIALATISFGIVTRLTRASMLDVMETDFFRLSLMKGLSRKKTVYGVALRNAALPLVTLIVLLFAYSVAGAVVIEDIFDYHGMGYFIVQAIDNLDYIAILDTTIIVGIAIIIANLIADVLYGILDPRVILE